MQDKKIDKLSQISELPSRIFIILGLSLMGINTLLFFFVPSIDPAICSAVFIAIYGLVSLIIYIIFHHKFDIFRSRKNEADEQRTNVIGSFRKQLSLPYAIVDEKGMIITSNNAFADAIGVKTTICSGELSTACGVDLAELIKALEEKNNKKEKSAATDESSASEQSEASREGFDPSHAIPFKSPRRAEIAEFSGRKYRMECHKLSSKGKIYYMIAFFDITELSELAALYKNNYVATGYVTIDNTDEIAQYVKVNYQDDTRRVGNLLKDWVSNMGGVICEHESNKFIFLFTYEMLSECIKNKFSIINEVHKIELNTEHIPMTISMGISTIGETLKEREHNAMIALDMALQRGGDQVALKTPQGISYFGAKTKSIQKRARGQGKIIYAKLSALISNASKVLIMGHRNPDFDCIGACIGVATLIKNVYSHVDVKIVTDTQNDNFIACTSRLIELAEYKDIFVDGVSALEYNDVDTLLIIVDANNVNILESPELAKAVYDKVFIDHHIKKDEFEEAPALSYIDHTASSTCELIAEMLEDALPPDASFKEEASIMMSGIMLDTKNFTRTVGMRTFAAALYLKGIGADTEYARTFFEEGFEDYVSESQFGSAAKTYRQNIAITSITDAGSVNPRVLAAKASDKLLTIKNIEAAFALILVGNTVNISARSNGTINVQLIVERLGGGGHFDMAGAAISNASLEEAEAMLKNAIDNYYDNIEAGHSLNKN